MTFPPRHMDVIRLIGTGRQVKGVAKALGLREATVRSYLRMIHARLAPLYPDYPPRVRVVLYYREHIASEGGPP